VSNPAPTPAGWYPDPWNPGGQRYWDGQQWTQHQAGGPAQGAAGAGAGYGAGYAGAGYGARPERPRVADDAPIYTPFIWIVALLPLVNAITIWFVHFNTQKFVDFINAAAAYDQSSGAGAPPLLDVWGLLGAGYWVLMGLAVASYVLGVVFAHLDRVRLERAGVVRPFHWAWAFLGGIVYVIGRSVIVHRVASPRGLAPIWVLLGAYGVSIVSSSIWSAIFTGDLTRQLSDLTGQFPNT